MSRSAMLVRVVAVCALMIALGGANCGRRVIGGDDAGTADAGPVLQSCTSAADCPDATNYDCVGVCLLKCTSNEACPAADFCAADHHCKDGCRDSSTCGDNKLCVSNACVDRGQVGSCTTKCDCKAGEACTDGACVSPPESCTSSDQCARGPATGGGAAGTDDRCNAYQCNGFTHTCIDPNPVPCTAAADCNDGRPGCENGCTCTGNHQCVPAVACAVGNESSTCGTGNYCDGNGSCQVLPSCTNNTVCASVGLQCNLGRSQCERPKPCTSSTDCTLQPSTFCDVRTNPSFCAEPNCLNGGTTCSSDLPTCAADGRCVPAGTGAACQSDNTCPADQYCELLVAAGVCTPGCRNNVSCNDSNLVCNSGHQCVSSGGTGGSGAFGAACTGLTDCQTGLICGLFSQTCAEACANAGASCSGDPTCCSVSHAANCNAFGFCSN